MRIIIEIILINTDINMRYSDMLHIVKFFWWIEFSKLIEI